MTHRHVFNPFGAALRQAELRRRYVQNDVTQNSPKSDPQLQQAAELLHFDKTARLAVGTITDTCALAHIYRVQFEKAHAPIPCAMLSQLSHSCMGPRDLRTLQAGAQVLCVLHAHLSSGLILAALNLPQLKTSKDTLQDMIFQGTRQHVDDGHKQPLRMMKNAGLPAFQAGRPFDSTMGGEWGSITSTGLRIYLDDFMAQLGNGEGCGITSFYHDELFRIAAYNLQLWTAGHEREGFNDQDEYFDKQSWTAYPWEQLGVFERKDPTKENDPEKWQLADGEPWYAHWEPQNDNQQPWHRAHLFHGYLGQGRKELHQTWPKDKPDFNLYYDQPKMVYMGLHDDTVSMTGERMISSAKRISIRRSPAVIVPKRVMRPEQPEIGDTEKNYKFAGLQGEGKDHKITSDIGANGKMPQLQRAAGILDLHGYLYNYSSFMGFYWHAKDWYTPEEKDLTHLEGKTFLKVPFSTLADQQYLDPPDPVKWDIDHRLKDQQFWQNECGIDFLEDGGVVLYGGCGEEIRLAGGHAFISAPGDVWNKAGRNVNTWAGFDIIQRAKNSVDVTATKHDVRVGAGRNLQLMAGGGEEKKGAVMIESRGEGATYDYKEGGEQVQANGIQFKSAKAEIVHWAKNIYLRTGGGNVQDGEICLDAAKGKKNVTFHCDSHYVYMREGAYHFFGQDGNVEKANEFRKDFTLLGSFTGINGPAIISGNIFNEGWIMTAHGHIATEMAKSNPYVTPLTGQALQGTLSACQMIQDQATKSGPQIGSTLYASMMETLWYGSERPGSDDTIRQAEFTLRSDDEYKTMGFQLYEDRWQQLGRLAGTASATWEEMTLTCECGDRMPYPGKANFDSSYCQQDCTIFDAAQERNKDRGEQPNLADPYGTPKYAEPKPVSLQQYLVIR